MYLMHAWPVFNLAAMISTKTGWLSIGLWRDRTHGLGLVALLGAASTWLVHWGELSRWGMSTLTMAIAIGILVGNTASDSVLGLAAAGIDFARSTLLRLGIVFFGFRISLVDVAEVGYVGFLMAVVVVSVTFGLALWVGIRWLKMECSAAILVGAGSAICGAAAVMAAQSVVRASERNVAAAVATVVAFGTLSMLIYPLLLAVSGLTPWQFGLFTGATVHEVAQVVAVAATLGQSEAANAAVIEKMLRVVLLTPFLLLLTIGYRNRQSGEPTGKWHAEHLPWFAIWFLVVVVIHSSGIVPAVIVSMLVNAGGLLLAMGMVAIGLRTRFASLREAGLQPIKLAAVLFVFLTLGGYLMTRVLLT